MQRAANGRFVALSFSDKFWSKVRKTKSCWLWIGGKASGGYGKFRMGKKTCLAHRISYEISNGKVLNSFTLDHLCRNRICVNPIHLEPVTAKENILRGIGLAASNARKVQCPRNHPYDRIAPNGQRYCVQCKAISVSKYRKKRKDNILWEKD